MSDRWTIRGVDDITIKMLREVSKNSGSGFGELVNEAVAFWYDRLPLVDDDHADIGVVGGLADQYAARSSD